MLAVETTIRTSPHLRVPDFICHKCHVQATREPDAICEMCKAIGKRMEPTDQQPGLWSDIRFGGTCAKRFFLGLGA